MKKNRKYFFKQIEDKGLITVRCPDCGNRFGLDSELIDKISESLVQYTCPYCNKKHLLK